MDRQLDTDFSSVPITLDGKILNVTLNIAFTSPELKLKMEQQKEVRLNDQINY